MLRYVIRRSMGLMATMFAVTLVVFAVTISRDDRAILLELFSLWPLFESPQR